MTSNAGSDQQEGTVGFGHSLNEQDEERTMKALQGFLRPEFINRVDEIVHFNRLTEDNFKGITRIMLDELRDSLEEKGVHFEYDDALVDYLTHKSYSRPMAPGTCADSSSGSWRTPSQPGSSTTTPIPSPSSGLSRGWRNSTLLPVSMSRRLGPAPSGAGAFFAAVWGIKGGELECVKNYLNLNGVLKLEKV